jgi:hypothetical protein
MADKAAGGCACAWVGRGGALQATFALDAAAAQDCAQAALRLQVRGAARAMRSATEPHTRARSC